MAKPTVFSTPSAFIGSSSEGLEFSRTVRSLLSQDAEVTLWSEDFFGLGSTFIETLINEVAKLLGARAFFEYFITLIVTKKY